MINKDNRAKDDGSPNRYAMRIGPITVRWSKDVYRAKVKIGAEDKRREYSNQVRNKLVANLLRQNSQFKAVLARWGLDNGIGSRGALQESKPPKGAVGVL